MIGTITATAALLTTPEALALLIMGLVAGLIAGILPGLTLVMGIVLALPFTYAMETTSAVVLLTAMYVAGTYGGAFTSILFRIPGEPLDIPLLWDGYAMARNGDAAMALGYTLAAAVLGGLCALLLAILVAAPFARLAISFSAPEFFALVVFGIASVVSLGGGSLLKGVISLLVGLLIATVGIDDVYGANRFSFGLPPLTDGISYICVMIGTYGLGEVLVRLERGFSTPRSVGGARLRTRLPSLIDVARVKGALFRSTAIGVLIGLVPGAGATVASFVAYGAEGQYGRRRDRLGSGIPEGIVAPQAASTASVGGAIICLLTLGIPGSGATAIIFGALMLHGLQPGPQVFMSSPQIVDAVFATILLGLIGMAIIGWVFVRGLVRILKAPEALISALVVLFCLVGALAERNNTNDLWLIVAFGAIGWALERNAFPIAPMVLGVILGPMAETNFITAMIGADNDPAVFATRPVAAALLCAAAVMVALRMFHSRQRDRAEAIGSHVAMSEERGS